MYYCGSYLGENFLYALYLGMSNKELHEKNYEGLALEIFDMEGTPICRYTFNGCPPKEFVVDENTFTLYGYAEDSESLTDSITVYSMPELEEYWRNKRLYRDY